MKAIIVILALSFSTSTAIAGLHGGGLVLGSATGFTYKYISSKRIEYDGHMGFLDGETDVRARRLHIRKKFWGRKRPIKNVRWYWGYGLAVKKRETTKEGREVTQTLIGPHAPIGARFVFRNPLVELFAEATVSIYVAPETLTNLGGNLGIRFFFQ